MFNTKAWGIRPYVVIMVVLGFGSRHVLGRPQGMLPVQAPDHDVPAAASGVEKPVLKFSPELLFEHTLESAASPASIYPHFPPSAVSKNIPVTGGGSTKAQEQARANGNNDDDGNEIPSVNSHNDWPDQGADTIEGGRSGQPFDDLDIPDNAVAPPGERPEPVGASEPFEEESGLQSGIPRIVKEDIDVDRPVAEYPLFQEPADGTAQLPEYHLQNKVLQSSDAAASDADYIQMPDDVPDLVNEVVFWQDLLEKDVDVDRPISHNRPAVPLTTNPDPEAPLSEEYDDATADSNSREISFWKDMATLDLDMNEEENPFDEEEEEEEEYVDDVPIELAMQVIKAMQAQPVWREEPDEPDGREAEAAWRSVDELGWGRKEARPCEEEEEYDIEWAPYGNVNPQGSRLIALIFQTIDVPDSVLNEMDEEDRAMLNKDMDIWQVLNNFPFQMFFRDNIDNSDDDYEEEYDDDDYDDDDYDYDDDDDDDIDVTYIVIDDAKYLKPEEDNDSDEVNDFFYSDDYDTFYDCKDGDCSEDDDKATDDDFTVISMPPMITKK